jgi:hypothetical protein
MTTSNAYATLAEFTAYLPNSGGLVAVNADNALDAASRAIDGETGHEFYPSIEARDYDTPRDDELYVHGDLCEVITLTNGDASTITAAEYKLWPYNTYPKASIRLLPLGTTFYNQGTANWDMAAISVDAIWACHPDYGRAWGAGTTLTAAISTTTATSLSVTASTAFAAGNITRIDNELMLVTATGSGTLTVTRGWNGSTAATHLNGAALTIWLYPPDIKRACLIQAARYYRRAETVYGTVGGGEMGVQAVAIPQLDPDVKNICAGYQQVVW